MWSCETGNEERLPIHNLKKIREENVSDVQHIHVFNSLQRVELRIMSSENFCVCMCVCLHVVCICGIHGHCGSRISVALHLQGSSPQFNALQKVLNRLLMRCTEEVQT